MSFCNGIMCNTQNIMDKLSIEDNSLNSNYPSYDEKWNLHQYSMFDNSQNITNNNIKLDKDIILQDYQQYKELEKKV